jgi:hypothetical protein
MKRIYTIATCILVVLAFIGIGPALAQEPQVPRVDQHFSPEKETRLKQLQALSVAEVFESLRSPEFFDQEAYLDKAIYVAFSPRITEALQTALGYVRSIQSQDDPEDAQNLYLAKRLFQIFPDESTDSLLDLYNGEGPKIKRNVIYATGEMAGGEAIKALLINALDDKDFCEGNTPESIGEPLRVCDMAYNQLVIRYNITDILRAIGTIHSIDVRDYHIAKLKDLL